MKNLQILLFFLIFSNFNSQSLNGIVRDSLNRSQQYFNMKLKNIDNGNEYFSHANFDGKYEFKNIKNGKYILSFTDNYYLNNQFNIEINGKTNIDFYVTKYCVYNENKNGICPNCKSKQDVIPVFYGLTTSKFEKKNRKKYHFKGCEISGCDPKWFCKKDRLEF